MKEEFELNSCPPKHIFYQYLEIVYIYFYTHVFWK